MTEKQNSNFLFGDSVVDDFFLDALHCQVLRTVDGSFSLRYSVEGHKLTEPMHSSKGALSETLMIYKPALEQSLKQSSDTHFWRVTSIGLGLGYNEILAGALALKKGLSPAHVYIDSFESIPQLVNSFQGYFSKQMSSTSFASPLSITYEDICERIALDAGVKKKELRNFLEEIIKNKNLVFYPGLSTELLESPEFTARSLRMSDCILFDAFSPASSPDLWTSELLQKIVELVSAPQCVFASYASRTTLKRVLKSANFKIEPRPGFAGKRESTFATRANFSNRG